MTVPPRTSASPSPLPGSPHTASPIPADDPQRTLTVVDPDDPILPHLAIVGGTYTILVTGPETAGRYCLIEMNVPPGGGPSPHRHDFEEMFYLLDGEIEFTFRGERSVGHAGHVVNIPANAPHSFKNVGDAPARLLCMCTPAGQEEFFMLVGRPVASRTSPAPALSQAELAEFVKRAQEAAPRFRTELLGP
jgi:quercetin dioxygenase-like cupin family protein